MNARVLIDAIVHQTTVLIAQLSTAAGIRAPLAHVADQVFLDLSRAIEAQGVSRKVVADMFGLAIRTYQKKVQRITETAQLRDPTLWQSVLVHLYESDSLSRRELLKRFEHEDPIIIGSVVSDLVSSGLVYRTGAGENAVFGITKDRDLAQAARELRRESLEPIVWVLIYRGIANTREALSEQLGVKPDELDEVLDRLEQQGHICGSGADANVPVFSAKKFVVPVNAEHGWEAAVFDHYQAAVRAIGLKVRQGRSRSAHDDVVGGATLGFDLCEGHPYLEATMRLLKTVRTQANELWNDVETYNTAHPINDQDRIEITFYFGQSVVRPSEE